MHENQIAALFLMFRRNITISFRKIKFNLVVSGVFGLFVSLKVGIFMKMYDLFEFGLFSSVL